MHLYKLFCKIYNSTIGKKWIVATTGLMMVGWLAGHMIGNLQIFAGPASSPELTKINQYAEFLHKNAALLWVVRIIMLKAIVLHIICTVQLTARNKKSRPSSYVIKKNVQSSAASRMMIFGGLFILFYIIYHLLHFTFWKIHPEAHIVGDLYSSMIASFQIPHLSIIYLLGQVALFFHLYHGIESAARTLGVSHPMYITVCKQAGFGVAILITGGFASIPFSVWLGIIS